MPRIYTVSYQGTVTAAGGDSDLLEIWPGTGKPIRLRGILLSQSSEVGDAAEEGLRISIMLLPATFTSGSGGSAVTARPMDSSDAACAGAFECNNTTIATTSGTAVTLAEFAWNERNSPYEMWFPDPDFAPKAHATEGMVVRMQTTPADDFSGCFTFWIQED